MPKRLTIEQIKVILANSGYKLANNIQYLNVLQSIAVVCEEGHEKYVTINLLYKKAKCNKCTDKLKRLSIEYVRDIFKNRGYTLLSKEYSGAREKLSVKCPNGHLWNISVNKFKDCNQECPDCTFLGGSSRLEKELFEIIKTQYPSAKKVKRRRLNIKNRPYVRGFDIDIYIPELKKGIEFDGTYFHSYAGLKRSYPMWPESAIMNYHKIKDDYFESEGIKLLHIEENEWKLDKNASVEKCLIFLKNTVTL